MKTLKSLTIILFIMLTGMAPVQAKSLGETNAAAGKAFMQKNAKLPGIQTTASGLQYKIIKAGDASGKTPGAKSKVTVNYEGRHLNGEVFDSSYKRNKPISFKLNRVIKGWTEGLQLMRIGAKYQLFIPPEIGYGEKGAGRAIGPQETLIFDVELLDVQ